MGNQPHQKIQTDVQQHERLGLIKFLQSPQSQDETQMIKIQRPIHSQKFYQDWVQKLKLISHNQGKQLFYLPQKYNFQTSGLCGTSGNVQMQFQYFPFLLKNQIRNRRNLNQYFDQTQIWYLLYKMVQAQAIFQKINMKIGDFNPKSILLNQNGQIRIISQLSLPGQNDNYTKITQHNLADVYLAPQQISVKDIEKARYPHGVNQNKAQIFCIGITLLQAATLEDCSFLLTRNPLKIQIQKLQKLRKIISQRYSSVLCQTLKQMTDIDPNKRKNGQQITNMLRPYEDMILDLQAFSWSNIQNNSSVEKSGYFHGVGSGLKKGSMIVGSRKGVI